MSLGILLFTRFRGAFVGKDEHGNRYYKERSPRQRSGTKQKERRWVLYDGYPDASKVPPLWNAWLHHTVDEAPDVNHVNQYDWQKPHLANMTGTAFAYRPPGSLLNRKPVNTTQDYEPWQPH